MKYVILVLSLVVIQANATTAILCGNPEQVDEDNNKASLHLIFDNSDSRHPEEIRAFSQGKELVIQSVSEVAQKISIELNGVNSSIELAARYIDPSRCENYSERTFSIKRIFGVKKAVIDYCRCFQD